MRLDLLEIIELNDEDNGCMAETAIVVLGEEIGFVGKSRHVSTTHEDALQVLRDVLKPLVEAIQAHPDVDLRSRFEFEIDRDEWYG